MRATVSVGQDKGTRLVRWTDEDGAVCGGEPYGGVGHTYAYGHEYGGGVTTDTVRLPACAPAVPPVPEPDTSERESARPVFVDSSGRRQRRVARTARLLVIPAGGYVALLISALLGGPAISSPFVPQADPPHPATPRPTAPDSPPGTVHARKNTGPLAERKTSGTAGRKAPSPADRSPAAVAPAATSRSTAAPTTAATTASATSPARPAAPAPTAAPAPSSKGRALGSSHRPVK
ncbi:hypothetical protein [Streptomyces durhamensis]|uniref:hypothetical protein n=1 Tax=Streptomyces durhamensis TaxID=68194 RepID=UPI0004CD9779|nr:hypothetical protein [Streptomyces durhamensis]